MNDLLLLVHRIPYPPNKGDKVRSYHLLKYLVQHYRVHLGTFVDVEEDWQYVDRVKSLCSTSYFAKLDSKRSRIRSLRGFLNGSALSLPYYFNADMQNWVSRTLSGNFIQRAVVYSSPMAQYLPHQSKEMVRVADLVDVDSDKWAQYAISKPWPLSWIYQREARQLLAYERQIAAEFDSVVFVNEKESDLFRSLAPESTERIGYTNNGVDTEYFDPALTYENPYPADEEILVFTGAMDYWPNVDAVEWFAENVFPAIRRKFNKVRFYIVGARPDARVNKLSELPGVTVTGSVPDIRPYLAHARLAVAPLRIARGTQNKVLEAMAMGKVVIASREASQGVDASDEVELIVAADVAKFIQRISECLSANIGDEMGSRARQCVVNNYGWDANLSRIGKLLERDTMRKSLTTLTENDRSAKILSFSNTKSA